MATVEGTGGRLEVYALPAPSEIKRSAGPRSINGDWEAIEDLPVPLLKISRDGSVEASNREARQLFDLETTEGKRLIDLVDGLGRPMDGWIQDAMMGRGGSASQFLRGLGTKYETFFQVTLNISDAADGRHLIAVLNDVTEFKTLEAQFLQSQKMQAVGHLAGGVAHDFNNLLTAISGHWDLLLERHDQGSADFGDLIQIHQNANRAAGLVKQLLAFSRKQNLQPERVDLRHTLADLTHLLNRLVGEKVSLSFEHQEDLGGIKADKRQLEQVVMNLVVNARDAMPSGGQIRVITRNRHLDNDILRDRATVPAGRYVELRVVDEGEGISPEVISKIFEPFYTTKRTGEGTGLGLSTVYGIVKQSGGFFLPTARLVKERPSPYFFHGTICLSRKEWFRRSPFLSPWRPAEKMSFSWWKMKRRSDLLLRVH
ncbi:two-component system sensor histidine kinase NtrB [Cognatiyoonia sediminum]|uniref:two-component system sensor histidine kinase NtrB n=1 Tax=Cognatiyoonia sediminum TaxID=1508389 RepID=UPI000B2DC8D3|nr:ATP-binding protein [Cognatiyoonia sediminum]